jgi:hypothetical protein
MKTTAINRKRRMAFPEPVCEAGKIRGRRLVAHKTKEAFPRGSLLKYFTPERDRDELAILSGCVKGPE